MLTKQADRNPLISVIMGVFYQRENTALLKRSVESILSQTYHNIELLICDDGSVSKAIYLLNEYAKLDTRIRLIRPGGYWGLAEKLNICLKEANGRYIARMDDDDFSDARRLEKQIAVLKEKSEISFVGCNVNLFCQDGIVGHRMLPEYPDVRSFLFTQPFIHPTLLFRKDVLAEVDGYSVCSYCELCEDYDLLLRLYTRGYRGMNLQEYLLDYSIPKTAHGSRTMRHRWNEAVTRFKRFRDLGLLPAAFPYVVKPLAVGLVPEKILRALKIWGRKFSYSTFRKVTSK